MSPLTAPLPVLYSFRRCPYAMRARLALAAAGIAVELREVLLARKPAALLQLSPKGTVPVLQLPTGQVLEQSLDIMHWALQQADPQGWLHGNAAATAALIAENDGPFKQALDRYKYFSRHPEQTRAQHQAKAGQFLAQLEARLAAQQGRGLLAVHCGLADMALLPFVRQCALVDAPWFAAQPWPLLQAWLATHTASTRFSCVMRVHVGWVEGTAGPVENWQSALLRDPIHGQVTVQPQESLPN